MRYVISIITGRNNIKKSTVEVNSNSVSFSASSSQVSEDSLSNNDSSSSHPPTPAEECTAKKISRKGRKEMAAEKNWTREETETLITLWEGNEILYNVSLSDYLDKDKKSVAVKQIAEQLETNEENVSKNMASLRSYYCQLRSQYKSAKTKSGSETADIKKTTWPFFDSLKFLDDNLTVKDTSSSINLSEVSQFKKKRKEVNSSEVDEWMTNQNALMSKLIQSYDEPKESTFMTEDGLFGQVIAKSIAKIPDGEIKEELKIEMQQCILNSTVL